MRYWLLQCNPKAWRIHDFLRDGHELEAWMIRRHLASVGAGDEVALWFTGRPGGVVGLGQVTGPPATVTPEEADDGYWVAGAPSTIRHQVPIRMLEYFFDSPVSRADLEADPDFAGAQIFRGPRAGNPFPLTELEWRAIALHLDRGPDPDFGAPWDLAPGEEIPRTELHERYGGSPQGRVSPSSRSRNVLLFTAADVGAGSGDADRWHVDGAFLYRGEGQAADQPLTPGNSAILDHRADGRHLRLFEGAAGVVRYVGEFAVDDGRPLQYGEARRLDDDQPRRGVRFRLRRVAEPERPGAANGRPAGTAYRPEDETVEIAAPAASSGADPDADGRGLRSHRRLQNLLATEVEEAGLVPRSPAPSDPEFDLGWEVNREHWVVVEVKSLTPSNEIRQLRMGLGQVLDYADVLQRRYRRVTRVIFLPREPTDRRWVRLAGEHGVLVRWPGALSGVPGIGQG